MRDAQKHLCYMIILGTFWACNGHKEPTPKTGLIRGPIVLGFTRHILNRQVGRQRKKCISIFCTACI
jgi:hypothetical protein